jgi:hypothetical protein
VEPRDSAIRPAGIDYGGERNAEGPGDLAPALAFSTQQQGLVPPEYSPGPSQAFTAPLCRTNAGHNALPDEFALEFRERGEYMQQQGCAQWSPERFAVRDSTQVLAVPPRGPSTSC